MTLSAASVDRIEALEPIDLVDLEAAAALTIRFDRKYLLGSSALDSIIGAIGSGHQALEIGGVRSFRYESVYFDTFELDSYMMAARRRPRRFKVRIRTYLDSGGCNCEVKERLRDGMTRKHRWPHPFQARHRLTAEAANRVAERTPFELAATGLGPKLTVTYRRSTLVDARSATRVTFDTNLSGWRPDGRFVELGGVVLLETKSAGEGTSLDHLLWDKGHRPVTISKYCTLMAALDPKLPANKWNRVLRRHFDWAPDRSGRPLPGADDPSARGKIRAGVKGSRGSSSR